MEIDIFFVIDWNQVDMCMWNFQSKHDHGEAASAAGGRTPSTGGAPRPRSRPAPPAKTTRAPWETDAADWSNLEEQE